MRGEGRHELLVAALASLALLACADPSHLLVCEGDGECVRGGEQGQCLAPGHCAFSDGDCASGLRWDSTADDALAGQCVIAGGGGDGGSTNACGGTAVLAGEPGTDCGACDTGTWQCDGVDAVQCAGEANLSVLVTPEGTVWASTEYDSSFAAELSVDGDLSTSWFSSGPEAGGQPTVYRWTGDVDDCITNVSLVGNGGHSNASFRTGYGFGQVTIQVRFRGSTVYSQVESMAGEPDPDIDHDTGGVVGDSVFLLFTGHEADDCGGFAELTVEALR